MFNNQTIVWSRKLNQGNKWRYAQIFIKNTGNYRIKIEGIVKLKKK